MHYRAAIAARFFRFRLCARCTTETASPLTLDPAHDLREHATARLPAGVRRNHAISGYHVRCSTLKFFAQLPRSRT